MKHRLIIAFLSLGIIAVIIVGGLSFGWRSQEARSPAADRNGQSTTSPAQATSTGIGGGIVPEIQVGPGPAEAAGETAAATPTIIAVNEPTSVTVTIKIMDTRLIPGSVNLQRLDAAGKVIAALGSLNDSGTSGDTTAGDRTYSIRKNFTEATTTPVRLRVSWALKGTLKRAASNVLTVEVWIRFSDEVGDYQVLIPPDVTVRKSSVALLEEARSIGLLSARVFEFDPDKDGPPGAYLIEVYRAGGSTSARDLIQALKPTMYPADAVKRDVAVGGLVGVRIASISAAQLGFYAIRDDGRFYALEWAAYGGEGSEELRRFENFVSSFLGGHP